jgi:hypothetical protein
MSTIGVVSAISVVAASHTDWLTLFKTAVQRRAAGMDRLLPALPLSESHASTSQQEHRCSVRAAWRERAGAYERAAVTSSFAPPAPHEHISNVLTVHVALTHQLQLPVETPVQSLQFT